MVTITQVFKMTTGKRWQFNEGCFGPVLVSPHGTSYQVRRREGAFEAKRTQGIYEK